MDIYLKEAVVVAIADGIGRKNILDAKQPEKWTDYSYDQLLDMVFGIMREKNPELASGKKKVFYETIINLFKNRHLWWNHHKFSEPVAKRRRSQISLKFVGC